MKRSLYIVRQEWCFLKSLVKDRILDIEKISLSVERALDRLSFEQKISRNDLIQIILINFRYSVLENIKNNKLKFDFTKLSVKEICYFYFMHRFKNSVKYLF